MLTSALVVLVIVVVAFACGFIAARPSSLPAARRVLRAWLAHVQHVLHAKIETASTPKNEHTLDVERTGEVARSSMPTTLSDEASSPAPAPPVLRASYEVVATDTHAPELGPSIVAFEVGTARGTVSTELALHASEWRAEMSAVGERFAAADVVACVFVHGTFTGSDPLSAYRVVERSLPGIGPSLARQLRKKTRSYVERVLGDLGNFGAPYVRLFEESIRPSTTAVPTASARAHIPCTDFVWSSENHHVGRLEGALGLVRVLATHAELAATAPPPNRKAKPPRARIRILVLGHSHAGQLFALVTQLLARSIAREAIFDVARARSLDVAALETDLTTLEDVCVDFVTFGAPARYAWASLASVRALHVIGVASEGGPRSGLGSGTRTGLGSRSRTETGAGSVLRSSSSSSSTPLGFSPPNPQVSSSSLRSSSSTDWIRRLGVEGSDFPPLGQEDRRINAALANALGRSDFAPSRLASAFRADAGLPANGEIAFVDYGDAARGVVGAMSTGLGHGSYTRLDAMLFHMRLVADRLYPNPPALFAPTTEPELPSDAQMDTTATTRTTTASAWSRLRTLLSPRNTT